MLRLLGISNYGPRCLTRNKAAVVIVIERTSDLDEVRRTLLAKPPDPELQLPSAIP